MEHLGEGLSVMFTWAAAHIVGLAAASGAVAVISVILAIVAISVAAQAKRKGRRKRPLDISSVEELHEVLRQDIQELQTQINQLQSDLTDTQEMLRKKVNAPAIMRFNAFGDIGSDLSFSFALVDDSKTGLVLSSIYGREESRTYAKPVLEGESNYPLTEEELEVLTGKPRQGDGGRRRRPVGAPLT